VRALLDVNVLVSALLSKRGAPARLVERWLDGEYELVVCEQLLSETALTLASPKLSSRIEPDAAADFVQLIRELGDLVPDPGEPPPLRSPDPGDDYLLALAAREQVILVSGDGHLLGLAGSAPIFAPRAFLDTLEAETGR
jgi:putative PIN family toxin of toxin-antitoxin system